jgi:carbon-monoxide dehydrogenase large subunit
MGEFAIGQPVARFEDPRLLRGGGRYVADFNPPGSAHGYVLRSSHAHAHLRGVDATAARQAPGVLAVYTGADWKTSGLGDLPAAGGRKRRDGSAMFQHPFPALAFDKVRWVGDPVAFVVAETLAQAMDAAEMIVVDYDPLPAHTDTATAMDAGVPQIWDECPNNISFVHLEGDKAAVEKALAEAAHVVRHRFVINRVTAATMEPRGCVGVFDSAADHYTLTTTLQRALGHRTDVARLLGIPESRLRIVAGDIGGSFGMKSGFFHEAALVLLAARDTGRPVRWTSTRNEAFLSDALARDNVSDAELALDKEGRFLGMRVTTIANMGAYVQPGGDMGAVANIGSLAGVYTTPAIHVDVTGVFTNTNSVRPYRGNGRPEAAYVIERMIDIAADELGLDPIELRRRNMIPPEAMP